jgi:hypothetical protein
MERRQVPHLDSAAILADAAEQSALAFENAGFADQRSEAASFWDY